MAVVCDLPVVIDLEAYRGDTWARSFRLLDEDGVPLDLGEYDLHAWVRCWDFVADLVVTVEAEPGVLTLSAPMEPVILAAGDFAYDLELRGVDDGSVTTWVRGVLSVRQDVTNSDLPWGAVAAVAGG